MKYGAGKPRETVGHLDEAFLASSRFPQRIVAEAKPWVFTAKAGKIARLPKKRGRVYLASSASEIDFFIWSVSNEKESAKKWIYGN